MGLKKTAMVSVSLLLSSVLVVSCGGSGGGAGRPAGEPGELANAWEWQNPLPQGNDLEGVSAVDADTCWAVGYAGTVLKTGDGGKSWRAQDPGTREHLMGVAALDADTALIAGKGGIVLKTVDGGETWVKKESGTSEDLEAITALDDRTAWAVGYHGTILKTGDGGESWQRQASGTDVVLEGVAPADGNVAWACGWYGTLLNTSDGGATWQAVTDYTTPWGGWTSFYAISATGPENCWVMGDRLVLWTGDGGRSWSARGGGADYGLVGMAAMDADTAWVCGGGGAISKTVNGGEEWSGQDTGSRDTIARMSVVDGDTVFAVGSSGALLRTSDGGLSWERGSSGPTPRIADVSAVDPRTAWAVGERGPVLKTVDGGAAWEEIRPDVELASRGMGEGTSEKGPLPLSAISAVDADTAWAVGGWEWSDGVIIKTEDGGADWVLQGGEMPPLVGVSAVDRNSCWAISAGSGAGGSVLRTTDGGAVWELVTPHAGEDIFWRDKREAAWGMGVLSGVCAVDEDTCWLSDSQGVAWKTVDGGKSWEYIKLETDDEVTAVHALDADACWVTCGDPGERCAVYKTADGGMTWQRQLSGDGFSLMDIYALDGDTAWAVGEGGAAYATGDGGGTWLKSDAATAHTLCAVSAAAPGAVWAVGTGGTILRGYHDPELDAAGMAVEPVEEGFERSGENARYDWELQYKAEESFMTRICAVDAGHVWATGSTFTVPDAAPVLCFYDGARWVRQEPPEAFVDISGVDAEHVWALGGEGRVYFYGGSSWSLQADLDKDIACICALDPCHVWAAGWEVVDGQGRGLIYFCDGSEWSLQSRTDWEAHYVFAAAPDHAWVNAGNIYAFDGAGWTVVAGYPGGRAAAADAQHVWALDIEDYASERWFRVLFHDGNAWSEQARLEDDLVAIAAADASHAWAAGNAENMGGGFIVFFDGSRWSRQYEAGEVVFQDIAAADADHVWALGLTGEIYYGARR